jgi:flagellar hook assembly protein FlgD
MAYACLVVANLTTNVNDMDYTYDVHEVSPADTDSVANHVFSLRPASPNPFGESTSISFTVPNEGGTVDVTIYDVAGRVVRELVCGDWMDAGDCAAVWDGLDDGGRTVGSGVYLVRLSIDGVTAREKLVALK